MIEIGDYVTTIQDGTLRLDEIYLITKVYSEGKNICGSSLVGPYRWNNYEPIYKCFWDKEVKKLDHEYVKKLAKAWDINIDK